MSVTDQKGTFGWVGGRSGSMFPCPTVIRDDGHVSGQKCDLQLCVVLKQNVKWKIKIFFNWGHNQDVWGPSTSHNRRGGLWLGTFQPFKYSTNDMYQQTIAGKQSTQMCHYLPGPICQIQNAGPLVCPGFQLAYQILFGP